MTARASKQRAARSTPIVPPADEDLSPETAESPDPSRRHAMIAEAAFFIAQERGFTPGQELDDWLAAEQHVDQRLSATRH